MTKVSARNEVCEICELLATGGPNDFEFVKSLIADFPAGQDAWIGRHWIINAIDCGSLVAVRWMIEQGVELKFRDSEGMTVLHAAIDCAGFDRYDMMRAFIAAGADVNAFGTNGWTPLHMAAVRNDIEAVKILLEAGADRTLQTKIDDYATPEEEATSDEAAKVIRNFQPHLPERKR